MKVIPLSRGKTAIVDDGDFERLSLRKWYLSGNGYAQAKMTPGRKGKIGYLHREILGDVPAGLLVDHINGDPLDNRRANLRLVTALQNSRNSKTRVDNSLGVKGVHIHRPCGRYRARIKVSGKYIHLGLFESIDAAKSAYDTAAAKLFGEFARVSN